MKIFLVFLFFISANVSFSSPLISMLDSIGLEKRGGQTFIIHQVSERETLFGISKRYQTTVNDLVQNNEVLQDGLKVGQRIYVPYTQQPTSAAPGPSIPISPSPIAKIKEHKVNQGETLFSISKTYGVTVGELMAWNNLKGNDLSLGQILKIEKEGTSNVTSTVNAPNNDLAKNNTRSEKEASKKVNAPVESVKSSAVDKKATPSNNSTGNINNASESFPGNWISHTVVQGETLFSISKKFGTSVEDIKAWNDMSTNGLRTGQKLKVGREVANAQTVAVIPASTSTEKVTPVVVPTARPATRPTASKSEESNEELVNTGFKNIKENGLAEVIDGSNNNKKYLVLHRTAPVGTIMRVRNDENDITIFARVVGRLPETGDNSKLLIKLSKAAYDQLRAVNARFPVEISF
jgi:LysM repeat protein